MNTEKQLKTMNVIFGIAGGLWAVWTVYLIVLNAKKPKVEVKTVNYEKGEAVVLINNKEKQLYKNSVISAGMADWGVRFNGPDDTTIDRIEVINNELVHQIIHS